MITLPQSKCLKMAIFSSAEISYHFDYAGEHRERSRRSFGFRLPLPRTEGIPDPGLPLPVRKVPEPTGESSRKTAKK